MYRVHRFHLKIDRELLKEIDHFRIKRGIKSREGVVNWIFETMEPLIEQVLCRDYKENMEDSCLDYVGGLSEDVVFNIRDYNFRKLQFLRFMFRSFSFATILRRLLRLFLILKKDVILEILQDFIDFNKDRVGWSMNYPTHMSMFEPKTTTTIHLDYQYRFKNITFFT